MSRHVIAVFAAIVFLPLWAQAAPLGPNAGPVAVTGAANDHDGHSGTFRIQALLAGGNFTGTGEIALGATVISGALNPKLSYVENGRCYFRWESGKARAAVSGACDNTAFTNGRMESFTPGDGSRNGEAQGKVTVGTPAAPAAASIALPTGKLTCAYQNRRIGAGNVDTQYSLAISNMASLTLAPAGIYRTANGAGRYSRSGNQIRLTGGPFDGALGTLEADRAGLPSVTFEIAQNRRANGVHIVDPYTTRCTQAR